MDGEPTKYESDRGQVEVRHDGKVLVLMWFDNASRSSKGDLRGTEMVRFDPDARLLRIFPKIGSSTGLDEQFEQVRELQIDTAVWGWNPPATITENDRGDLELVGLPDGFGKIFSYGLGLPRAYRGLVYEIEKHTECSVVRFGGSRGEGSRSNIFRLSLERFVQYKQAVDRNRGRGHTVVGRINAVEASNAIADLIGSTPAQVSLGRHPTIQAITRAVTDNTALDAAERSALMARMSTESRNVATESPQAFGKLRKDIELVSLEVLVEQFDEGLRGAMAKDEAKWQTFFETNTFALQQLFAAPVALYGKQLHLRMPNMRGEGSRIADFVLVNTVTRNAVVVEIKTPATRLLGRRYRGTGGAEVFPPHNDLSGAIAQLQAQMESALTDFQAMVSRTPGAESLETCVVRGAVIAGTIGPLSSEQRLSFMRYRNGLHGTEVITFDEVRDRLKGLYDMLAATVGDDS